MARPRGRPRIRPGRVTTVTVDPPIQEAMRVIRAAFGMSHRDVMNEIAGPAIFAKADEGRKALAKKRKGG